MIYACNVQNHDHELQILVSSSSCSTFFVSGKTSYARVKICDIVSVITRSLEYNTFI